MADINTKKLAGKVALITGGSRGIGAAIVKRLAEDGAEVAFTYYKSKALSDEVVRAVEAAGGRAISIQADNGSVDDVKNAVAETIKTLGHLDILVNNASLALLNSIEEIKFEEFTRMFTVNVQGAFVATQEASRHMGPGGRIINIGSINSDYIPFNMGSLYSLTKGAIAGFTRGVARDLGPRGITINNIQPGPTETDMNPSDTPFADQARSFMALPNYAQGADIASLVAYIASPEAFFITGAQLKIDGGYTA